MGEKRKTIEELLAKLQEAQDTIAAIQGGQVDALVVTTDAGEQIFTLKSAEQPYRILVENMEEGALTLLRDGTILYCNQRFADMTRKPLEDLIGSRIFNHFDPAQRGELKALLEKNAARGEFSLWSGDQSRIPVVISPSSTVLDGVPNICFVVTDLSEQKRHEAEIIKLNEGLERRVAERTAQLSTEVAERRRAEEKTKAQNEKLQTALEENQAIQEELQVQHNELTKAQQNISAERKRYEDLFHFAPEAYLTTDLQGTIQEINCAALLLFDVQVAEAIGTSLAVYVAQDAKGAFLKHLQDSQKPGARVEFELLFQPRRYPPFKAAITAGNVTDSEGNPIGCRWLIRDVSQRERAEQALRESEERFRAAQELSPDGFTILRPVRDDGGRVVDFTWVYENAAIARLNGTDPDLVVGRRVSEVLPGQTASPFYELYSRVVETGEPGVLEAVFQSGNMPEARWFRVAVIRMGSDLAVLAQDITERKQSEEKLRESELRYRSLAEASAQVVWTTNARGEVNFEIPAWQEYVGQSAEEARGFGWMDAVHPEDRERVAAAWAQAFATNSIYEVEYRLRRHDRQWRDILARGVPVPDGHGGVREYVGTCIDITERKHAEENLRRSQAMLARAEQIARFGSWEWVIDSGELIWSENTYRLLEVSPERFVPRFEAFLAKVYPEDRERLQAAIDTALRSNTFFEIEFRISIAQSDPRWLHSRGEVILDENNRPVRMIGSALDVTDRKAIEQALAAAKESAEQAKDAAEKANAAKDHFLAVLSHELRTPLTPVLMTASALATEPDLPPQFREDMDLIRRSVELEVGLINDLLDVNRIARGKVELDLQELDANAKIESSLESCRIDMNERGLHLRCSLDAREHFIKADPGRIQQVFWNLLKNAVKFTSRGGRIEIRSHNPQPGRLRIEVKDTGIGIEPEAIPRLFSAFEQASQQVTRQFGGLGLGLTICKSLVEMHGGLIWAESPGLGKGATFIVELPTVSPRLTESSGIAANSAQVNQSLRILLVEDHEISADILHRVLTRAGHTVRAANSVRSALDAAREFEFDLLISDLGLPDGNGYDLLRELRRRRPDTLGIALSGYGMDHDIQRSKEAGFSEHLIKPVEADLLKAAIRRTARANGMCTFGREQVSE